MAIVILDNPDLAHTVVRKMCLLAYRACAGPTGMGVHSADEDATVEKIWDDCMPLFEGFGDRHMRVDADYVVGCRLKLRLHSDAKLGLIRWRDEAFDDNPNGWMIQPDFGSVLGLLAAAAKACEVDFGVLVPPTRCVRPT